MKNVLVDWSGLSIQRLLLTVVFEILVLLADDGDGIHGMLIEERAALQAGSLAALAPQLNDTWATYEQVVLELLFFSKHICYTLINNFANIRLVKLVCLTIMILFARDPKPIQ